MRALIADIATVLIVPWIVFGIWTHQLERCRQLGYEIAYSWMTRKGGRDDSLDSDSRT